MNIFDLYRMPTAPKTNQRYWTRKRRLDHVRRTRRSKAFEQRITPEVRPDDPVKEIIVAAAIKERNGTFYGTRHGAIIRQMVRRHNYTKVVGEQGFLTSAGRFLNREDAAKLAIASGQIKELKFSQQHLFSEDLW